MNLKNSHNQHAGFTLTELLVSISIMVFVLAIILVNYNKFDSGIVLTNLGYDIGLSVRKAQTYGINVKGTDNNYIYSYGVHFDKSSDAAKKTYLIFADKDNNGDGTYGNGKYDCPDPTNLVTCEKIEGYKLQGNFQIKDVYTEDCTTFCGYAQLDILFKRPNPDAIIFHTLSSGGTGTSNSAAVVEIYSPRDPTVIKKVVVYVTGQISIK